MNRIASKPAGRKLRSRMNPSDCNANKAGQTFVTKNATPLSIDTSATAAPSTSRAVITPNEAANAASTSNNTNKKNVANKFTYEASFPEIVHSIVSECTKTHPDMISWMHDGTAFRINNKDPRLKIVLKQYFLHGNYETLQRQLNMYGFSKHVTGAFQGCFVHPFFSRDSTDFRGIERRPPPSRLAKKIEKKKKKKKASSKLLAKSVHRVAKSVKHGAKYPCSPSSKPLVKKNMDSAIKARKQLPFSPEPEPGEPLHHLIAVAAAARDSEARKMAVDPGFVPIATATELSTTTTLKVRPTPTKADRGDEEHWSPLFRVSQESVPKVASVSSSICLSITPAHDGDLCSLATLSQQSDEDFLPVAAQGAYFYPGLAHPGAPPLNRESSAFAPLPLLRRQSSGFSVSFAQRIGKTFAFSDNLTTKCSLSEDKLPFYY